MPYVSPTLQHTNPVFALVLDEDGGSTDGQVVGIFTTEAAARKKAQGMIASCKVYQIAGS
jgi:hypothetical protein